MPKRKLAAVDYEASVPDDTVEESGELPDEYTPADGITLTPLPTAPISVDINLATVNLRSLLKKVNTLMLQLATSETNIAFVQEANLTAALSTTIQNHELAKSFTILHADITAEKGQCDTFIMVKKSLNAHPKFVPSLSDARRTVVFLELYGLLLVNVHAPTPSIPQYFEDLLEKLLPYKEAGYQLIVGGYFNVAYQLEDRPQASYREAGRPALHELTRRLILVDSESCAHEMAEIPFADRLSFHISNNEQDGSQGTSESPRISRLDYIFVSQSLVSGVQPTAIKDWSLGSDHCTLFVRIPVAVRKQKHSRDNPRIPVEYFKNIQVVRKFEKIVRRIFKSNDPFKTWTLAKSAMVSYATAEMHKQDKSALTRLRRLHKEIHRLTYYTKHSPNRDKTLESLKDEANRAFAEARQNIRDSIASKSLYFAKQLNEFATKLKKQKLNYQSNGIAAIRHSVTHPIVSEPDNLRNAVFTHFERAFAEAPSDDSARNKLFRRLKLRLKNTGGFSEHITAQDIIAITDEDIRHAVRRSAKGKAPGLDGIPFELYRCSPYFRNILQHLAKALLAQPDNVDARFTEGRIILIYKAGDPTLLKNYRPITLLNSDYKIISSIVAERLTNAVAPVISHCQHAIIPGRSIHDNIQTVNMLTRYLDVTNQSGILFFLDQEKAYDRISHVLLYELLSLFGIPASISRIIKNLYASAVSRVTVNGMNSQPFDIRCGIRQGDALSCVLFVMVMELLGCALEELPQVAQIPLPDFMSDPKPTHLLYVDDAVVFLSSFNYYDKLEAALQCFCSATHAKFNTSKTNILAIGLNTGSVPDSIHLTPRGEFVEHLGTPVGMDLDYKAITSAKLDAVLNIALKYTRQPMSAIERAHILRIYIIPKLLYLFRVLPFSDTQLDNFDGKLRKLVWRPRCPWIHKDVATLPACKGGLGLPCTKHLHRIAQIQWGHHLLTAAAHLATNNSTAITNIPSWYWLLVALWHHDIIIHPLSPKSAIQAGNALGWIHTFWDPIIQNSASIQPRPSIIGKYWHKIIKVYHQRDGGKLQISLDLDSGRGSTGNLPLFYSVPLANISGRSWNYLVKSILAIPRSSIRPLSPFITLGWFKNIKRTTSLNLSPALHKILLAIVHPIKSCSKPYWHNLMLIIPGDVSARPLSASAWSSTRQLHQALQWIPPEKAPVAPPLPSGCAPFVQSANNKISVFVRVERCTAPHFVRNTLQRLLHNKMPRLHNKGTPSYHCPACNECSTDSATHTLGSCTATQTLRFMFIENWLKFYKLFESEILRESPMTPISIALEAPSSGSELSTTPVSIALEAPSSGSKSSVTPVNIVLEAPSSGSKSSTTPVSIALEAPSSGSKSSVTPVNIALEALSSGSGLSTMSVSTALEAPSSGSKLSTTPINIALEAPSAGSGLSATPISIALEAPSAGSGLSATPVRVALRAMDVRLPPSFWLYAPCMGWASVQLHIKTSRKAKAFQRLWELSSSLFLYVLWLRRCNCIFDGIVWPTKHAVNVYNDLLRKYWAFLCKDHPAASSWLPHILLRPGEDDRSLS